MLLALGQRALGGFGLGDIFESADDQLDWLAGVLGFWHGGDFQPQRRRPAGRVHAHNHLAHGLPAAQRLHCREFGRRERRPILFDRPPGRVRDEPADDAVEGQPQDFLRGRVGRKDGAVFIL